MLRLAKVGRGGEAYYLSPTLAGGGTGAYVEPDGRWTGAQSAELGLAGSAVDAASLRAILQGLDPISGAPLDATRRRVLVAAFDCTFAAPKSVSVLHALAPTDVTEEVRAAHERAVAGALGFLERNAAFIRRDGGIRPSIGFAAAEFLHRASRAPDPHLHTHLLIANLGGANGRWSAIDGRPLFAHVGVAGALYRAGLRHELTAGLGVAWQDRLDGFADLIGLPVQALRAFSRRSAAIAAELERTGGSGRKALRLAAARTRPPKDLSVEYATLVEGWRERAFELGISRSVVRGVAGLETRSRGVESTTAGEVARSVAQATEALDRRFDRRELMRAAAARLESGAPARTIEMEVDSHLASTAVVACGESLGRLGSGPRGRFPSGLTERRYATIEIAALGGRLAELVDGASQLLTRGWDDEATALGSGVFTLADAANPRRSYEVIRLLAQRATEAGRPAIALTPTARWAAHLEATTGIDTARWGDVSTLANGALVVVADPIRAPLRAAVDLLSDATHRHLTVLVAPRAQAEVAENDEPQSWRLRPSVERHVQFGVAMSVAPNLAAASEEVHRLARRFRSVGGPVHVVSVEDHCVGTASGDVLRPGDVGRAVRADPGARFVVLGGARLLGPVAARIPDAHRAHVVVAPVVDQTDDYGWRLAVAEPASVTRILGRYPESMRDRHRWLAKAAEVDRSPDLAREVDRSPPSP